MAIRHQFRATHVTDRRRREDAEQREQVIAPGGNCRFSTGTAPSL
jgi:hypothetical protein